MRRLLSLFPTEVRRLSRARKSIKTVKPWQYEDWKPGEGLHTTLQGYCNLALAVVIQAIRDKDKSWILERRLFDRSTLTLGRLTSLLFDSGQDSILPAIEALFSLIAYRVKRNRDRKTLEALIELIQLKAREDADFQAIDFFVEGLRSWACGGCQVEVGHKTAEYRLVRIDTRDALVSRLQSIYYREVYAPLNSVEDDTGHE